MLEFQVLTNLEALGVEDGERIGIACSGGADSVALVHLLAASSRFEVDVLHVDHGLRPDSDQDAVFVERMAARLGLPSHVSRVNVERRSRTSLEAAAREARYNALSEAGDALGLRWIATAHTLDDQAETVLLRTLRGGSLAAIAPTRDLFIRPLLDVRRSELRRWLTERRIEWREDPTNDDTRLERNWVRAELLPMLERRRAGVAKVLARSAATRRQDESVLDALAADVVGRAPSDEAGIFLDSDELDLLPPAISTRVVRSALRRLGNDPTWSDLEAIRALEERGRVRTGQVVVWRLSEGFALLREPLVTPGESALPAAGVVDLPDWSIRLRVGPLEAPRWRWRAALPSESAGLVLRSRRPGDRVATRAGTRKVQDVLVDAKVPRPLRDFVPVLATPGRALAVVGLTAPGDRGALVVDVEPNKPSWSREPSWNASS